MTLLRFPAFISAFLLAGPALSADLAESVEVLPPDDGLIWAAEFEGAGGWSFVNYNGNNNSEIADDNYAILKGDARINIPFSDAFSAQLDAGGIHTFADIPNRGPSRGGGNLKDNYYAAGHLAYRDPSRLAPAAMIMAGNAYGGEDSSGPEWRGESVLGALEGQ